MRLLLSAAAGDAVPSPASACASAFAVVGVFVIGFGVWAAYAPLESAAIAGGAIEAESSRKTIQHLEGGIVGRILVNDGDVVTRATPHRP